jgi:serine protease
MRKAFAAFLSASVAVLLAACSSGDPSVAGEPSVAEASQNLDAIEPGMRVHWQKGTSQASAGTSSTSPLVDHGGRVLSSSKTYAIFWGTPSAFPTDLKTGIASLFEGLAGTSFLGIAQQYMRGAATGTGWVTSADDTSAPPSRGPSTSTIVSEACKVIHANGWPTDPNAVYFVYTSNFPSGHVSYCAWHGAGTCDGQTIQVAYMPNTTGMAGCDPGNTYACNGYSQGTRSIANVTSHEYMEALTDADPGTTGAWTDSGGSEIGDKCAWKFSSCVALSTGNWQLQEEWSNAAGGCVQ